MIRFAQINMNGQRIVAEQLRDYCSAHDTDIILAQEPPLTNNSTAVFGFNHGDIRTIMKPGTTDQPSGAAIIILNPRLSVITPANQNANVASMVMKLDRGRNIRVVSAYFK